MNYTRFEEEAERSRTLERLAPIRERYFKLLQESKKQRIDHRTIKIIVK